MIRKRNKFERPRKIYDKARIFEENNLLKKYGLKNKKEIWKANGKIKYFRRRAKSLITASEEEKKNFFLKLNKFGLDVKSIAEVLALKLDDILKRRLPTMLVSKKLATTPRQARQMVVHRLVKIENRVVDVPSYLVGFDEEKFISVDIKPKKIKMEENEESDGEAEQ